MSSHEVHSAKIMEWLEDRAGIRLKPEYFSKWFDTWSSSQGDTIHHNSEVVYKAAYEAFLRQSIEKSSRPVIPSNYADNSTKLFPPLGFERGGGVILQIMDCHDITRPLHSMLTVMTDKSRKPGVINFDENTGYTENSSKRVLRWVLSDGTHQIPALEKKRIAGIDMFTPFGCKLLISKCDVSLGILFLKPSNTKVLGGCVPRLYKGNMMKELINRFQQRLIIYNSKAVNNQNIHHEQISEEVDEYSDLDEADLNRINEMEAELSKPSTSYSSEASLNRTFYLLMTTVMNFLNFVKNILLVHP
ncbi:hypothetical protein BDF14DRAFT_1151021 [Spinellus fusiger]|nr:hypothetical protein BDF14DRAFT_1151021 [Spinellus fusiger]